MKPQPVLILLSLLVVNVVLLAKIVYSRVYDGARVLHRKPYTYVGADYPEFLPLLSPMRTVAMTVEESVHYSFIGAASSGPWTTAEFSSGGYTHLGPDLRLFAVPMLHELHCIYIFYLALIGRLEHPQHHTQHCLDYVRQFILCQPDLTLEPGDFMETDFEQEEGVGMTHVCRDWSSVYREVESSWKEWDALRANGTQGKGWI